MNLAEIEAWNAANARARRAYYNQENKLRLCPVCDRSHTGASQTCAACHKRASRAAKKTGGPQMERRYWLTPKGYAALAQLDEEPR